VNVKSGALPSYMWQRNLHKPSDA